jgi:signal peptidase I
MVKPGSLLALLAVGLFVAWFLFLRPAFLGGPTSYVRVSGVSMEPSLHQGDLAVVRKQGSYSPGDVVAFRVPRGEAGDGSIVIHRIIGGTAEEGFIMQGDNKENPDLWRPTQDDIVGGMWFRVPRAGGVLPSLQDPLRLAGLASGFAVFLVLSADTEKKRPRKGSPGPGKLLSAGRRRWRPPGLTLWARRFEDREGRHP